MRSERTPVGFARDGGLVEEAWPHARNPELAAAPKADLRAVWEQVADRHLELRAAGHSSGWMVALLGDGSSSEPLTYGEREILVPVLCGRQQKQAAGDSKIACSTASKRYTLGAKRLGLHGAPIPLPLIVAAQAWASKDSLAADARGFTFRRRGQHYFLIGVPRPDFSGVGGLTPAERDVASRCVEGQSKVEIARIRSTSLSTISCQIRSVYSKCKSTGRYALVAYAAAEGQLQWRAGPLPAPAPPT